MVNACEVASLAMLLQHAGVKVTKEELADEIPIVPLVDENGLHGNPNKAFVGAMEGELGGQGGYSVYHGPIAALAQSHLLNRSFKVVDLTGQKFTVLLKELASGNPVWVITTTTMQPDMLEEVWETPDGTMRVNWMLHSVAVTGFDDKHTVGKSADYSVPWRKKLRLGFSPRDIFRYNAAVIYKRIIKSSIFLRITNIHSASQHAI
jgi:uncharacterized protein YvpB